MKKNLNIRVGQNKKMEDLPMKKWAVRAVIKEDMYKRFVEIAHERHQDVSKMVRQYIYETIESADNAADKEHNQC